MKPASARQPGASVPTRPRTNAARGEAGGARAAGPADSVELAGSPRVTPEGRLRLILSFPSGEEARGVRDSWPQASGGRIAEDLPLVNGFTAEVEADRLEELLKTLPEGSRVALDRSLDLPDPRRLTKKEEGVSHPPGLDVSPSLIGIQQVWDRGYTGKGQAIAIVDSGIHPHPDLKDKIVGWVDLTEQTSQPLDQFGHGTHVAGVAAGSGALSAGRFKGIAPDANLVGVRIGTVAEAIKGIQWVIENKERLNIGVINLSLGDFATRSYKEDPWAQATQKAMEAGLVVVVAGGNEGPSNGSISTPGTHPDVITVGALDDKRTPDRGDDAVADFSSRGPTSIDGFSKPDLLAPGVGIYGPLAPGATMDVPELPHFGKDYFAVSGTSMATPMVSGLAAILLQANPNLSHLDIKEILVKTADRYLHDESNVQGAGLVDAAEALDLALSWPGRSEPVTAAPIAATAQAAAPSPSRSHPGDGEGFLFA